MRGAIKTAYWIAWRELSRRKSDLFLSVLVTAMAVALCAALEIMSAAREADISEKIDRMGAPILVTPAKGRRAFDGPTLVSLENDIAQNARAMETRAVTDLEIMGMSGFLVGVVPDQAVNESTGYAGLGHFEAVLGKELSRGISKNEGGVVPMKGRDFLVKAVLPETAGRDDVSMFVRVSDMEWLTGPNLTNEIHVYPGPGRDRSDVASHIREENPGVTVTEIDRGEVADHEITASLIEYRWVIYLVSALLVGAAVTFESWMNVKDREVELATFTVVGTDNASMINALIIRGGMVGFSGAFLGVLLGAASAMALGSFPSSTFLDSALRFTALIGAAGLVSATASVPAAIFVTHSDPVKVLQD